MPPQPLPAQALAPPQSQAQQMLTLYWRGFKSEAQERAAVATFDALWADAVAWMAEGCAAAMRVRDASVQAILENPHERKILPAYEAAWLDRLLGCRPELPAALAPETEYCAGLNKPRAVESARVGLFPIFFDDELGPMAWDRLKGVTDALERSFGVDVLKPIVSAQFLTAHAHWQPMAYDLKSPWLTVALPNGWLNEKARDTLFAGQRFCSNNTNPVACGLANSWIFMDETKPVLNDFLAQGLDPNLVYGFHNAKGAWKRTNLLHDAIREGGADLVRVLIKMRVKPRPSGRGRKARAPQVPLAM